MKKLILLAICLLSLSVFADHYGFRLGLNRSSFEVESPLLTGTIAEKDKTGFSIAATYERKILNKLTLSLDLAYSKYKGTQTNDPNSKGLIFIEDQIDYNYLTFRPILSYNITAGLGALGGLTLETPLKAKVEETISAFASGQLNSSTESADIKSDSKSLKTSLNLGDEYRFHLKKLTLVPRLMYQLGLTPNYYKNNNKIKQDVMILDLGILF